MGDPTRRTDRTAPRDAHGQHPQSPVDPGRPLPQSPVDPGRPLLPSPTDPDDPGAHPPDVPDDPRAGSMGATDSRRLNSPEEAVLPAVSSDERDVGWGGDDWRDDGSRDAWYERERPPHHEG